MADIEDSTQVAITQLQSLSVEFGNRKAAIDLAVSVLQGLYEAKLPEKDAEISRLQAENDALKNPAADEQADA